MIALDTNVFVRFITCDDSVQSALAKKLILNYKGQSRSIYLNELVLCELFWVLKSGYRYSREEIAKVFNMLLDVEEFDISNRDVVFAALIFYKNGKGDFSDYLIHSLNKRHGCSSTYSFDQKATQEGIFQAII